MAANEDQALLALVRYVREMYVRIAAQKDIGQASRLHSEVTAHLERAIGKMEEDGVSPQKIRAALATVELPVGTFEEERLSNKNQIAEVNRSGYEFTMLIPVSAAAITRFVSNCTSPLCAIEDFVTLVNEREAVTLSMSYKIITLVASGYQRENEISNGVMLKTGYGRSVLPEGYMFRYVDGAMYTVVEPVLYQPAERVEAVYARLARLTQTRFSELFNMRQLIRAELFPESDRKFVTGGEQYILEKTLKDYAVMKRLYSMAAAKHQICIILRLREGVM